MTDAINILLIVLLACSTYSVARIAARLWQVLGRIEEQERQFKERL